jgi:hypothetical protein
MSYCDSLKLNLRDVSASRWGYVFLLVSLFCLVAQWSVPPGIRPFYLSAGTLTVFLAATVVLISQVSKDRLLLTFIVAVLLYWLLAFPPAINGSDDNTAYLIFAKDFYTSLEKTIQPLSERRIFSVGGLYAFQGPVLHWIGQYSLSLVEPVFGLILFFVLVTSRHAQPNNFGSYILVGLLAMTPLAGSKVLANTSSVFLLSAFSFALLELGKDILQKRNADWTQVALLVVLPLAAATFRPTTAPFNGAITLLLVLVVVFRLNESKKTITLGALGLLIFFLALLPYREIGGTYLYPVLGRGFHITAEGYSISGSVALASHFSNFFKAALVDPLFWTIGALVVLLARTEHMRQQRLMLLAPYAVYVGCYFLMAVGTGGLAAARYMFPVSLAIVVSLILLVIDAFQNSIFADRRRLTTALKAGWALAIIGGLVIIRFTVGPAVIEKRLKMYEPSEDMKPTIEAVQNIVNKTPGATLIVALGVDRFLVERINGRYFIMDQPGTLSPWMDRKMTYEQGLREFIVNNDIRSIALNTPDCSARKNTPESYVGWAGVAAVASQRNASAICNILKDFDIQVVGPFTVATK